MFLEHIFECPRCSGNLEISASKWVCTNCNKDWVVDQDGVVHFSDNGYFFGANRKNFNKLLEEIRKMTAKQFYRSVESLEEEYEDFSYSYCLDPIRADWTVLGNFNKKIIVDLGCGFGSISRPIATRAKAVISIDATLERLNFLSIVSRIEEIENIIPINSKAFNLPLKQEAIDAIVTVGLLEWIGQSEKGVSPEELQRRFLKYLRKLLSRNGELWIGVENRFTPYHFIGKTHHGDLPFTPLMPRFMADLIYRIFRGTLYETRTYTKSEYQNLLNSAGFHNVEFFHAFPHYQRSSFIASHSEKKIISKYLEKANYVSKSLRILAFLDRLHMSEVFAPAFLIKAKRRD